MKPEDPNHADELFASAVVGRLVADLGEEASSRVLACLRTARSLLALGDRDDGLRYAESAAYNVREALESVVQDRHAGEGGFKAVVEAWDLYKMTCRLPGADERRAMSDLAATLDGLVGQQERQGFMTRKLLEWFRQQNGVEPLRGDGDPVARYQGLRDRASTTLHTDSAAVEVQILFDETIDWFTRFFTPPSEIADRLGQLAAQPFSTNAIVELQSLATTDHHLRMFFAQLEDPAWLEPLRAEGFIRLPLPTSGWPAAVLASKSCPLPGDAIAALLARLLADLKSVDKDYRRSCAWELARTASWLGNDGVDVMLEVLRLYPTDDPTQIIVISGVERLDSTDPVHARVADLVLGNEPGRDHGHRTRTVLDRLIQGLTEGNVVERFTILGTKVRKLAATKVRHAFFGIESLAVGGDDYPDTLRLIVTSLARLIPAARVLGMPGLLMLELTSKIPGELGERLTCLVLAGAPDIDRAAKVAHLTKRLVSEAATGDDLALVQDLSPLDDAEIDTLRAAMGGPDPRPGTGTSESFGGNWARGWRWSIVLPVQVLEGWQNAIDEVTAAKGEPDPTALVEPMPTPVASWGESPIDKESLETLDVLDAAMAVAAWRPSPDDDWGVSARQLARTLQAIVTSDPTAWAAQPEAVVRILREPIHVDHYFRGLAARASAVSDRATAILDAIDLALAERWDPAFLGDDPFEIEPNWSSAELVAVELIDALADANANLHGILDRCWAHATRLAGETPADLGNPDQYSETRDVEDPLHRAINSRYGKGLEAALALGGWEHRNAGEASTRLAHTLDQTLRVEGAVGLELRSILAASYPFVEGIASEWLDRNDPELFDSPHGHVTFEQALKYGRPTAALYQRSFDRLIAAAHRGAEHAVAWLLLAYLWDEPDDALDTIIDGLSRSSDAVTQLCKELPRLASTITTENTEVLERAVRAWQDLLEHPRRAVAADALRGLGGWANVALLPHARWATLTEQTVESTAGAIDQVTEVAERCRDAQPSRTALRILTKVLGHGDRWEQHHVETMAVEALTIVGASGKVDRTAEELRERVIKRGRNDALQIPGFE